ncbi:unnamed protein product [Clonostachys chloroleuca]|uniref:Cell wall glucanase n=1 Tax=Clonostachys chloroleuca TaxID=1926264 RepID=A0AA35Q811_9HYPO|nr:unnamed protein product [Clonostachys chloroleuca]
MDDTDPTRSPRHYATPPRARNFSPPARQPGSSKTPKLGDFSRIGPSFISPASSPRPHAAGDQATSPRSHSAFPSPQRTRRGSQSIFSRDQTASLGNFSKLLAVLQSPSRPTSAPKSISRAVPEVGELKPSADTTPRITILKRGAAGPSDQASPASGLLPSRSPNVVAAIDVKADDPIAFPALSPNAELSSSPSELESTSESEVSDYDGTSATSLASSPSQHLTPQRKASVSDSWNSLNKRRETIVSPSQQQPSATNTPFARNITTPPTVLLTDTRTKAQKHESLSVKLARHFVNDSLTQSQYRTADSNAVHVFLDHSNINISFRRALQSKFANGDFSARFNPSPEFNLEFFSEILLRGRQVRILNAGCSTRPDHPQPAFVDELRRLGYHVDVRERKPVVGDPKPHHTKTHASSKHPRKRKTAGAPHDDTRYVEDLVDETLQTRIGESVMEFFQDQGTLVLATGDGKPAKYSDGFFAYADRALRMGWNVELVSWNLGLSSSWSDPEWTRKWGPRFRIIQLDEFLDDLWVPAT